jgi:hypothetical protein
MKINYSDYIRQGWRIYNISLKEHHLSPLSVKLESDVMYDSENQLLFVK